MNTNVHQLMMRDFTHLSRGNDMRKEKYLELVRKLNVLINNELLEKENIATLATKTTQTLSDMPKAPGTSDKVGNLALKLLMKQIEIDNMIDVYVDLRCEIKEQIRTLQTDECDVLFKYYILNMGLFDIAEDRGQSVDWIKKLKWRGTNKIKVIESEAYKEACRYLKF